MTSTNGVDTASCGGALMPLRVRCARTEERRLVVSCWCAISLGVVIFLKTTDEAVRVRL